MEDIDIMPNTTLLNVSMFVKGVFVGTLISLATYLLWCFV